MSSVQVAEFQLPEQAEINVDSIKSKHTLLMKMLDTLNNESENVLQDIEKMQRQRLKVNKGE